MIDPKWPVIGVALISAALAFNFDLRLGLAAVALLMVAGAIFLWASIRMSGGPRGLRSEREVLFGRYAKLARNRQTARIKELSSKRGSDPR